MLAIVQAANDKIRSFAQAIDALPNDEVTLDGYRPTFKALTTELANVRATNPAISAADSAALSAAAIMCEDIANQTAAHINSLMVRVHAYIGTSQAAPRPAAVIQTATQAKTTNMAAIVAAALAALIFFLLLKK